MSEWTPTTEQVRAVWCAFSEYGGLVDREHSGLWDDRLAEFDRLIERVKAEAKAEVLEEAAREWAADPDAWGDNDKDFRNELRDRAAAIRAAAENGESNDPEV